jgi:hypothetical protein
MDFKEQRIARIKRILSCANLFVYFFASEASKVERANFVRELIGCISEKLK